MKRLFLLLFALLPMLVSAQGVTPFRYDTVQKFSDGTAIVVHNGKYGLIKMGKEIVPPEYKEIKRITDDKYLLTSNGLSIADSKGNIVHNVMIYTSSDGKIVEPRYSDCFDANIVLNAYYGNIGIMAFDKPITKITNGAFMYCDTLTDITIPESVTTVAGNIFKGCTSLPVIDGFRYAGTYLVERVDKTLKSYTIKSGTRFVGDNALDFSRDDNNRLNMSWENRSLTAPDTIVFVGEGNNLCCIVGLNIIVTDLKKHCENPNPLIGYAVGDGDYSPVQLFIDGLKPSKLTLPNGVKKISDYAFAGCTHIESIIIPDSVTEIERYAFHYSGLTSVIIPNSITKLESNLFWESNLTNILIPNSVMEIGEETFCLSAVGRVTIGKGIKKIRRSAFHGCYGLETVYCKAITPPILEEVHGSLPFDDNAPNRKIYVPRKSVAAYQRAAGWSRYADSIVGYDF